MDRAITVLLDFRFDANSTTNFHVDILNIFHKKVFEVAYSVLHSDAKKLIIYFDPVLIVVRSYEGDENDLMITINMEMPK